MGFGSSQSWGVLVYHLDAQMWSECPAVHKSDALSYLIHRTCGQGNFGVPLFFAISAFILTTPIMRLLGTGRSFSFRDYLIRRITRIEPPYVICLVAFYLLYLVTEQKDITTFTQRLLASLLYLHNIIYGEPSAVNGVAWSLEIEVQFYLLAPFVVFALFRLPTIPRRMLLVGLISTGCLCGDHVVGLNLVTAGQYFTTGLLMADIYCNTWNAAPSRHRAYDLLAILALVCAVISPSGHATGLVSVLTRLAWVAAILLFFTSGLRGVATNWLLTRYPVYLVGGMCYSIYLWHSAYWRKLWRMTTGRVVDFYYPHYFLIFGTVFLAVILISCVFFYLLFERPFMQRDWLQRSARWLGFSKAVTIS